MTKRHVERFTAAAAVVAALATAGCAAASGSATPSLASNAPGNVRADATPTYKVYTAGKTRGFPSGAFAADISPGPAGTMWFTDGGAYPGIGRISSGGAIREFRTGLISYSKPFRIALGSDGYMWFTDAASLAVGKVSPAGAITEYVATKQSGEGARGLAFGSDGTPWFVTSGGNAVLGNLNAHGKIALTKIPANLAPDGTLAADASGNLWFIALNQTSSEGLVMERLPSGKLKQFPMHLFHGAEPCCPNEAPSRLTIGPDGNPWFTTQYFVSNTSAANFFGTVRSGKVVLFKVKDQNKTGAAFPSGIASGKSVWFTGGDPFGLSGGLWNVGSKGAQFAYKLPFNPFGLTVDGKGNPWFTATFNSTPSQIVEAIVK